MYEIEKKRKDERRLQHRHRTFNRFLHYPDCAHSDFIAR
jgi:hypothetical protein